MKFKPVICAALASLLCISQTGCASPAPAKKQITLNIKTTPIGLGNIPGVGDAEVYDMLEAAADKFKAQYDKYDVTFEISRYFYLDEKEQLADKYGTGEAADIFYSGSWNLPTYVARGWMVPLDDIIDEELRSDIDQKIWDQNTIDGKVYTMPFQQLQNTLMVNKKMMEEAGLEQYIPKGDTVAHWSTEEFELILGKLQDSLEGNQFAFMMYAANNQGDSHIMTLLRSHGSTLYDENGKFAVNTPEGIRALEWLKELDAQGITPKGAENMELLDCMSLFNNSQLAICVGNLTNLWDAWNKGLDIFLVNFPSLDGNGYATSSTNGFCVFDNKDEDKIQAAKDFIRFIYSDEDLMKYSLGTLPVNRSVTEAYKDEIRMLQAYGDNNGNVVDNIRNNLGWQGVRDVFYPNIQALLLGSMTPSEAAFFIDESCNAALEKGRAEAKGE
ncbi:extracellular solute-binding protein [Clostridium sp. MCC353]|uniref:ABC transporter substrate-binding protein n=1 Tax=Clostridium sp. MCC353 TaxID=2592646 RepID=UPI001C01098F|nr:extracellular solute-binding protein [Clostridium sp. MCC353]MBT9776444.1 extracellular solute-binding protein [Clostridium sp. MCC353]